MQILQYFAEGDPDRQDAEEHPQLAVREVAQEKGQRRHPPPYGRRGVRACRRSEHEAPTALTTGGKTAHV